MLWGAWLGVNLRVTWRTRVLHCAKSFWGSCGYFSSVNRWAMTASCHHGTVRLGEHGNRSSSCFYCD
jgi:hypothetical protein